MDFDTLRLKTCAGIVLYNPEIEKLKKNIDSLIEQVNEIVLIDNHSKNVQDIEDLLEKYSGKISYIANSENLGIAAALNQIFKYAELNKYEWFVSMDQDSCCSDNMISAYAEIVGNEDNIGILCPYVLNNGKESLEEYNEKSMPVIDFISDPIDCITSGCLNNVKAVADIYGYDEKLFIDCVDVDLNIRLMKKGYKIVKVNAAYLIQYMGEKKRVYFIELLYKITHKNIFRRLRFTPVYSTFRLYYIARNSKYVWMKYGNLAGRKMTPSWMRFQFIYYFLTYPISYNRIKFCSAIIKGSRDSIHMELKV